MKRKILVIRRDNIGDLVLTTPLLAALRAKLPDARIDVLTNSYAAPVLVGNTDVDNVYVYSKAHHRGERETKLGVFLHRWRLIRSLRRESYDTILLAKPMVEPRPLALARMIGAREIVGVAEEGSPLERKLTHVLRWSPEVGGHVAERTFQLASHFDISGHPGPLRLFPQEAELRAARERLAPVLRLGIPVYAVNLSARKINQRWPVQSFVQFMRAIHERFGAVFMLVWSPGDELNPMHPGDDAKAREVMSALGNVPCVAYATSELRELIAGLSLANGMVTSDGGAMHIGAAVGLPILALFGNSEVERWRPWGVPYEVLQPATQVVADITVDAALAAWGRVMAGCAASPRKADQR